MGQFISSLIATRGYPHDGIGLADAPGEMTLPVPPALPNPVNRETVIGLLYGTTVYHRTARNADGTALRARVNGMVKLWKRRPLDFSLPMKHGMYDYFYIEPANADDWTTVEPVHPPRPRRR